VTPFAKSSKARLTTADLGRFPGATLFERAARAICGARCLPRKELFEAWEVARRVRRQFRGGRVVDLGGGHGVLAHFLLLLDDTSPSAVVVDRAIPPSAAKLHAAFTDPWPRLAGRVTFRTADIADVSIEPADLVVSAHACGALTDVVLDRAADAGARVVVLPCCHDLNACDPGPLAGWIDGPTAIDVMRAVRLEQRGYRVWTQTIPPSITPKHRLLLGTPDSAVGGRARPRMLEER
jgi:hypothetical protein